MPTRIQKIRISAKGSAQHEAGHCIVGRHHGFQTDEIFIDVSDQGTSGGSSTSPHTELKTVEDVASYLEKRIQVLCAGVLAEHLNGASINAEAADRAFKTTAMNDWSKVTELVRTLCGIRFAEFDDLGVALEKVAAEHLNASAEIVIRECRKVRAVTDVLIAKVNDYGHYALSSAEIDEAIKTIES
jgi:hypothetical protein